ncbi:DUF87 domain-containing protein [Sulfurimonas sp. SAG-AH-194-I05]|nr:DUF87 domain-containing protein [Sulfurimonas sp. SAG-AH-194-I05]
MTKQQQAQLNQRLRLSKEDVAYEVLGFESYPTTNISNKINLGHIIPSNIDKMIMDVTQHYILHISKILLDIYALHDKNDYKNTLHHYHEKRKQVEEKQFISYKEYLDIFKASYEIKNIYMNINGYPQRERELKSFSLRYKSDVQGYYKLLKNQKYPVNKFLTQPLDLFLDTSFLEHGSYLSGRAGSGKTELMKILIDGIIKSNKTSLVVIDIHGDFSTEICKALDDRDMDRLIYIDLFAGSDKHLMPSINPFDIKSSDEQVISIATENILNTIKMVIGEKEFTNVMRALLAPVINTLLRLEGATLYDLYLFMDDRKNQSLVDYGIKNCQGLFSHYLENDFLEKDKSRTKQAIKTRLQILLNFEAFSNFLTNPSTFDFEEAMNSKKIIVFKFNKILMRESAAEICRFLMSNIQTIAMKRFNTDKNNRSMTHCFLDEFQNFTSGDISETLSESRKYKLFLHLSHQYLGQIESPYLRGSIMTNCELKFSGMNSSAHNTAIAKEFNIDTKELSKLNQVGKFYLKRHSSDAFKFQASSRLVDKKITSKQEKSWNAILDYQFSKYYKVIDKNRKIFVDIPQEANTTQVTISKKKQSHYSKDTSNGLNALIDSFDDEILDY